MNAIELAIIGQSWTARFSGPHAAQVKKLFFTDILPLPYTPQAAAEMVLTETQKRNPGVIVTLREVR